MLTIVKKELQSYLSSFIAYIVMGVFLLVTGLFLWIFPDYSLLEYGMANLDQLFIMAPWIFMFLIPAITMRSFAEERKSGTIELLMTKPLTDFQIILGKFFGCLALVLFSLLPTVLYYISLYRLADPIGNVDTAGIVGSYLGLFLLASAFVGIGIFSSSLTDNQIVAFVSAVFFCFVFYAAFDSIGLLSFPNSVLLVIEQLGINAHYVSLSKGVIDSRDLVYFLSFDAVCIYLTAHFLQKRYR